MSVTHTAASELMICFLASLKILVATENDKQKLCVSQAANAHKKIT